MEAKQNHRSKKFLAHIYIYIYIYNDIYISIYVFLYLASRGDVPPGEGPLGRGPLGGVPGEGSPGDGVPWGGMPCGGVPWDGGPGGVPIWGRWTNPGAPETSILWGPEPRFSSRFLILLPFEFAFDFSIYF